MNELENILRLAGVKSNNTESGSNITITAQEKARIMREHNIKPGTDAWFRLWFSKPYLTGERPI